MDELEIDGKKYLSSRRAAKEHKYHTDYIGQLIRAGRVKGKKVGRSWYVEDESLKNYLLTENQPPAAEPKPNVVAPPLPEPVQEEVQEQTPPPMQFASRVIEPITHVEERLDERVVSERVVTFETPKAVSEPQEEKQVYFSAPAPKKTLTYVEDDEPMLPVLNGRSNADFVSIPMRRIQDTPADAAPEIKAEEPVVEVFEKPRRKVLSVKRFATIALIAAVVVGVVAISSSFLATSIKVNEGQAASVGVTIK